MTSKPSINNTVTGRKDSILKIRLGFNTQDIKKILNLHFSKQTITQPTLGAGQAVLICSQPRNAGLPGRNQSRKFLVLH